jgi:hypothetical protein
MGLIELDKSEIDTVVGSGVLSYFFNFVGGAGGAWYVSNYIIKNYNSVYGAQNSAIFLYAAFLGGTFVGAVLGALIDHSEVKANKIDL